MESLHEPCTVKKRDYDRCFNVWLAEYLQLADMPGNGTDKLQSIQTKGKEYEQRCGETWRAYRTCLQVRLFPTQISELDSVSKKRKERS